MKKILHIPNYYNPHIGGIEQTCEDIVNSLKDNDVEQRIICFKDAAHSELDKVDDIDVVRVGCQIKVASQSLAWSYKKYLKSEFEEYKPDIVIFHYPNPYVAHFLLPFLRKNKNVKFILYWHLDITKQKIIGKLFDHQNLELLNRADKIVSTSELYAKNSKFLPNFMDKVVIIPSCVSIRNVDKDELNKAILKIKEENKDKKIVFSFGRHVEHKGFQHLIEAAKMLPEYNFYLGGKGPYTDELKNKACGLSNFKFLGKLDNIDLEAYLNASDVFAFPSVTKAEAYGLALAEALMHGCPAVTFSIKGSGVNFVSVNKITGLEVENANSKAFAEAIKKILSDDELRNKYSREAKQRAYSLLSFEAFKENINNLINNM
ncbi:MAG: glycosyltransferase [Acholeplasmatales bacterium]|nr:glycosyltransferase [Acholeplasmatales bacterium]